MTGKRDRAELADDYDRVVARWQQSDLEDADIVLHHLYDAWVAVESARERMKVADRRVRYEEARLQAMVESAEKQLNEEDE